MKSSVCTERKKLFVLAICGMVSALPFLIEELGFVSFITYVPLFYTLIKDDYSGKRAFSSLFCFMYPFYFLLYHWFVCLYPLSFAGLDNVQSIIVVLIAVLLIPFVHSTIMSACVALSYRLCKNKKVILPVVFAIAYMLGEYLQSVGTFAFPWGRLFVGQIGFLPFLQSASLFGSYFITFVIVLINALVAYSFASHKEKKIAPALLALFVFLSNLTFGVVRISNRVQPDEFLTVSALQGNITTEEKWSNESNENSFQKHLLVEEDIKRYTEKTGNQIDLYVTSETAFPITLVKDGKLNNTSGVKEVLSFADSLISDTEAVVLVGAFSEKEDKTYNSIFKCTKKGVFADCYNKQHIVPFGEFLPYRALLELIFPAFSNMNLLGNDLTAGKNETPIITEKVKIAPLVCFDSVFPQLCRKQVKEGARLVAVSTNDSWYKTSRALNQHAYHSVMRAIENNVSVVRSANTGISMTINPYGEITNSLGAYKTGAVCDKLPITSKVTFYTKIGDVIVPIGAFLLVVFAVLSGGVKKNKSSKDI